MSERMTYKESMKKKPSAESSAKSFIAWLKKKGWTTEGFAKDSGVSYHTVQKWRMGKTPRRFFKESLRRVYADCPLFV